MADARASNKCAESAAEAQSEWAIHFPTFRLTCTSQQWQIIRDVVTNLILYQQPRRAAHHDRFQSMVYAVQLGHVRPDKETLASLQDHIRDLVAENMEIKYGLFKVRVARGVRISTLSLTYMHLCSCARGAKRRSAPLPRKPI